jgi:methylmalonyl-CoA mutase, N-terminal domain
LGGSWFVEALTDELERQAEQIFSTLKHKGDGSMLEGVLSAIEGNWFQGEIADSAYIFERKVSSGRRLVVGVNAFFEGNEEPAPPTLLIGPEVDEAQQKRLTAVRQQRNQAQVDDALAAVVRDATEAEVNLMPAILGAVRVYATVGEIVGALAGVFSRWAEVPVV